MVYTATLETMRTMQADNKLSRFQVISEWGVKCRTPRCSGFATLSRIVLRDGVKHLRPSKRGVGTCQVCGCQYSIRPEQIEHRLVEAHNK
jgi:hypothetical protein